jgi:uncharacterized protein YbjQ (UPF0145 family)
MIITTMNDLPGYEIEELLGEVFGLTAPRSAPMAQPCARASASAC